MIEYVLWGTSKDSKEWEEEIITVTKDLNHLEKAREWALLNGFHNLRVLETFKGDKPNFK
jgi:hypothetical protein